MEVLCKVKSRIRQKLLEAKENRPSVPIDQQPVQQIEPYYTATEVAKLIKVHPDTIRNLFKSENSGVLRIGNNRSTAHKRRYTVERYSASAVNRLLMRLQYEDPRYSAA